jgi:2-methylcitrate dehydratase PrpD
VYAPDHGSVSGLADRLGNPFEVVDPGLAYKLHPCCADLAAAVDAILDLRAAHQLDAASVRRIRCGVTPLARSNSMYGVPKTPSEGKFSLEYCVAAALVRGRLSLSEFEQAAVDDPTIRDLMGRIDVAVDPDLSGEESVSFASPAIVEVDTVDGRTLRKMVRAPRGHPDNPLTAAELEAKFAACAARALVGEAVRRAFDLVMDLENVPNVRDLLRELTRVSGRDENGIGGAKGT